MRKLLYLSPLLCLLPALPAHAPTTADRIARLEAEVATLRAEMAEIKATVRDGEIAKYYVDSVAGKIECNTCRFVEEK